MIKFSKVMGPYKLTSRGLMFIKYSELFFPLTYKECILDIHQGKVFILYKGLRNIGDVYIDRHGLACIGYDAKVVAHDSMGDAFMVVDKFKSYRYSKISYMMVSNSNGRRYMEYSYENITFRVVRYKKFEFAYIIHPYKLQRTFMNSEGESKVTTAEARFHDIDSVLDAIEKYNKGRIKNVSTPTREINGIEHMISPPARMTPDMDTKCLSSTYFSESTSSSHRFYMKYLQMTIDKKYFNISDDTLPFDMLLKEQLILDEPNRITASRTTTYKSKFNMALYVIIMVLKDIPLKDRDYKFYNEILSEDMVDKYLILSMTDEVRKICGLTENMPTEEVMYRIDKRINEIDYK